MLWIRFRTKMSSGRSEWQYEKFNSKSEVDPYLQSVADNHNWSEHWRGIDWEVVKRPPLFILKEKLDRAFRNTDSIKKELEDNDKEIKYLAKMVNTKHHKIKVSCVSCGYKTYCKGVRCRDGSMAYGNNPLKKNSEECIEKFVLNQGR